MAGFTQIFLLLMVVGFYVVAFFVHRITRRRAKLKNLTSEQRSTNALLVELDSLKTRNLISEAEHDKRRKQIMDDFVSRTSKYRP